MAKKPTETSKDKSLESWIWDAACSIRGAQDAPKFKNYILPLIFVKRLCDVFDDEVNRIAKDVGTREKAFRMIERDHSLVRFFLPIKPTDPNDSVWSVIRKLSGKIGNDLTTLLRGIAKENESLSGIIDRSDFNATTHGQRDIDDLRLSNLIEKISQKRLGLSDVEPDIIGRSYEFLIRKFAEGGGQSAGEFYTPLEVGLIMARIMDPEPGMEIYDPTCGSGGLLIKCELVLDEKMDRASKKKFAPLKLYGQEFTADTWAMAKMNMIIHDMEGEIEIGDTMNHPKFRERNGLKKFDRVVANPMWNQPGFPEVLYTNDELGRFPAKYPGSKADWGWLQHIFSSLKEGGRAAVVLDTGAASRGSGNAGSNRERDARKWFVDRDLIEGVIYLPENLFYNTSAPGIIIFFNNAAKKKKGEIFLINASSEFEKGDPKNFITEKQQKKIADTYVRRKEIEKFSRTINLVEIAKNDYNISPSRYIQTSDAEEYRPISEIIESLNVLDAEAIQIDRAMKRMLLELAE
jgi:type I restriction enzyme M protein